MNNQNPVFSVVLEHLKKINNDTSTINRSMTQRRNPKPRYKFNKISPQRRLIFELLNKAESALREHFLMLGQINSAIKKSIKQSEVINTIKTQLEVDCVNADSEEKEKNMIIKSFEATDNYLNKQIIKKLKEFSKKQIELRMTMHEVIKGLCFQDISFDDWKYVGSQFVTFQKSDFPVEIRNIDFKYIRNPIRHSFKVYKHLMFFDSKERESSILGQLPSKLEKSVIKKYDENDEKIKKFLESNKYNFDKRQIKHKQKKFNCSRLSKLAFKIRSNNSNFFYPIIQKSKKRHRDSISIRLYNYFILEKHKKFLTKDNEHIFINKESFLTAVEKFSRKTDFEYLVNHRRPEVIVPNYDHETFQVSIIYFKKELVLTLSFVNPSSVSNEEAHFLTSIQFHRLFSQCSVYSFDHLNTKKYLRHIKDIKKEQLRKMHLEKGDFTLFQEFTNLKLLEILSFSFQHQLRQELLSSDAEIQGTYFVSLVDSYFKLLTFNYPDSLSISGMTANPKKCFFCQKYERVFWCKENDQEILQFPFWLRGGSANHCYHLICFELDREEGYDNKFRDFVSMEKY